jgi:hypothetical protein
MKLKVGQKKIFAVGEFNLGKEVIVSDPSYEVGIWCQAKLNSVKAGKYIGFAEMIHDADWGVRVSRLYAINKDFASREYWNWELDSNEIGVDSGQAGIFDMSNYRNDQVEFQNVPNVPFMDDMKGDEAGDTWYRNITKITLNKDYGIYESGIFSRSGIGDGGYSLYTEYEDGQVIGICIDYHMDFDGDDIEVRDGLKYFWYDVINNELSNSK